MRKQFILFLILNINIFALQANINSSMLKTNRNKSNTSTDSSSSSKNKFSNFKYCLCIIGVISFLFLLIFFLAKISTKCCIKNLVYSKFFEEYEKNGLEINNRFLITIKDVYGIRYIFSFLLEKVFISTKYNNEKSKYLDTCTICMDDFNEKDKIYTTSCEHIFHRKCIEKYLNLIQQQLQRRNIENLNDYLKCPNCKCFLLSMHKLSKEENNKNNKESNINSSKEKKNNIIINNNELNNIGNDVIYVELGRNINKERDIKKVKIIDSNIKQDNNLNNISKNKNEIIIEKISSFYENDGSSRKIIWAKNQKLNSLRILRNKVK